MRKLYYLLFLLLLPVFFLIPKLALAQDQTTINKDEVKNGMQIITANQVDIEGTIIGDIFIISQSTTIAGKIEGNLFIATTTLNMTQDAKVSGSLFVVSQKMSLNGSISGSTYLAASEISTGQKFMANQELNFAAKSANLDGTFSRQINGSAETINLNGKFEANLLLKTTNLTYEPNLNVLGDIKYYAPYSALVKTDGDLSPTVTSDDFNKTNLPTFWNKFAQSLSIKLLGLIYLLIIGFLWIWLWRDKYETVVESLKDQLWPSLGFGIIVWLLIPAAFLILIFTIIGIPLALILLGFVIFWSYLSTIIAGGLLGRFVINLINKNEIKYPYLALFLGILILIVLYAIPIIGPIIKVIAAILAFGILVVNRKQILNLSF